MDVYELIVFVHIAAAVALLSGSVFASPGVRAAIRRARTTQEVRAHLAIGRPLLVLEPASALVVLASGVYLTSAANFWTLGWVQVAVASWLVNSGVAGAVIKPAIAGVAARAASTPDGPVGPDLDALRWSRRWSVGGDLVMANDAAMLYLMTMKPELAGSLLTVVAANLAVAAARASRHGVRRAEIDGAATASPAGDEPPVTSAIPPTEAVPAGQGAGAGTKIGSTDEQVR
jgi:uncharacterized membrane protein